MKIEILCVGKIKDTYNKSLIETYCKEIRKKNHTITIKEYPDLKILDKINEGQKQQLLSKECERMSQEIGNGDYVIALCIEGKELTTEKHRSYIEPILSDKDKKLIYIIGGSLGLPEAIKKRGNLKLSFSKMTFPHQLMRVVLCEEVNRVLEYGNYL